MAFYEKTNLNINSKLLDLSTPQVMGIINLTSDSYFAESRVSDVDELVARAGQMIKDGASILDLGAMSTRPGAIDLGEEVELARLIPAIQALTYAFPEIIISIDTYRSEVAKQCIAVGAHIINDISGGQADPKMINTVAELQVPYIIMHMKGMPHTMQDNPQYDNVVLEIFSQLNSTCKKLTEAGIKDIIIDPGFGFGKTVDHNYEILDHLDHFKNIGHPLLVGISRKSMIYKPLDSTPEDSLPATSALHRLALEKGANILRVHDVKEAADLITNF
ncbi:MAG: dihydropteroate synthase [Patiriisocius sp.]|jgi:dihydropteroate synthase